MIQSWDDPPSLRVHRPWVTWVALSVLWVGTFAGQLWMWPVLFLGWAAYDVVTGESNFVQHITRRTNPVTFWLIVASWVVLSLLWLLYPDG